MSVGLVMTAGGARAAYQVGVLARIGALPRYTRNPSPFRVLEGVSAGAINAAALASGADDLGASTRRLASVWSALEMSDVVRTDLGHLLGNALLWIWDLTFGGLAGGGHARSLLDASPLRRLLLRTIDPARIAAHVDAGRVRALAVVATDYASGRACLFVQGAPDVQPWRGSRRATLWTPITIEHVMASAAIPVVFAPVPLDTPSGSSWFGDGCLRLPAPLGPAIHLGADRILAIGLRHRPADPHTHEAHLSSGAPPLAQVMGVALSNLFIDQLDSDTEHLTRLNRELTRRQRGRPRRAAGHGLRRVEVLFIAPSLDLASLAATHARRVPPQIRYLLGGLGMRSEASAELLSYLIFDAAYTRALIDVGWRDADARVDEIERFLEGASAGNATSNAPP